MNNNIKKLKTVNFKQNGSSMFVTTMTANELIAFTKVDPYNPTLDFDDENQGYQRNPSKARIRKLGNFLDNGIKKNKVIPMPTAILLSSRGVDLKEDSDGCITFPTNQKFSTIDGQHRIEGIRHAIENRQNEKLGDFGYAVVIMPGLSKVEEMYQFKIVNGEAKSVNTALVSMLLTQVAKHDGDYEEKDNWRIIASDVLKKMNDNKKGCVV